jgi:hypothetical protein
LYLTVVKQLLVQVTQDRMPMVVPAAAYIPPLAIVNGTSAHGGAISQFRAVQNEGHRIEVYRARGHLATIADMAQYLKVFDPDAAGLVRLGVQ